MDDELSPFSQSVELAEELERRGMPYEFYSYEGLSHHFSTSADNQTQQQMFQDSLDCLRGFLRGEEWVAHSIQQFLAVHISFPHRHCCEDCLPLCAILQNADERLWSTMQVARAR